MHSALILGESHTGKTRSLGTLPGRTILFNFDGPDNVTSLRVPYIERARLKAFWQEKVAIEKILVLNYTAPPAEISFAATPEPKVEKVRWLIEDVNSVKEHLSEFDNLALETLGPFGNEVLDFIVASNNRKDTQIQDYKVAISKLMNILYGMMSWGKNVIVTGHLQTERDEVTGRGRVTPQIWGKDLPNSIPKIFGEVFQSVVIPGTGGGIEYKWLTKPDPTNLIGFLGSRKKDAGELAKYINQDFNYLVDLNNKQTGGK